MVHLKRFFCLFLALVLLLTWPGFLPQKAQADSVASDSAVMSLALLFTTWAGITFQQSDQAVTAMRNFISSKTSTAASLAGLITKGLVTEAGKLLITGDVRTAFRDALTDIQDFFQVKSDAVSSAGGGMLADNIVLGVFYDVPFDGSEVYYPVGLFLDYDVRLLDTTSGKITSTYHNYYNFSSEEADLLVAPVYKTDGGSQTSFICRYYRSSIANARVLTKDDTRYRYNKSYQIRFNSFSNSVSFNQSQTVNGSSVSSSLDSVDLDTADASISIAPVTDVISSGVAGSTAAPGLSAEDYERILADVLAGTAVLPTTPDPTTAEPTETTPEEDKETMVSPDIFNKGLTGVKDTIAEGFSSVVARLDWAIHYLTDWFTTFWEALIKAVTVTIPDFLSGMADSISTFFTVTFPAWVTDVKDWALTLPKTISDAIAVALAAVFVPAAGYWDAKVVALQAAFPLFDSIVVSAGSLRNFFQGLGSRPPIIYIDLGNSASWAMGGKTIFLDLTWYSQYKPTMDTVLSAFLWIFALWRIFLRLPSLIRGGSGDWGSGTVVDEHTSSTESSTDLTIQR